MCRLLDLDSVLEKGLYLANRYHTKLEVHLLYLKDIPRVDYMHQLGARAMENRVHHSRHFLLMKRKLQKTWKAETWGPFPPLIKPGKKVIIIYSLHGRLLCMYIWPLNVGLNFTGPLIRIFFFSKYCKYVFFLWFS